MERRKGTMLNHRISVFSNSYQRTFVFNAFGYAPKGCEIYKEYIQ